jgi:hypothetical protein
METLTQSNLLLFLVFVAPGFIASRTYRLWVPAELPDAKYVLLEVITFSMIIFGLTFWLPVLLWQSKTLKESPLLFVVTAFVAVVAIPVLLGSTAAWVRRTRRLVVWFHHPAASAWDAMLEQREERFVLATLHDGTLIGGYFGPRSYASAMPKTPDIFLEQTWRLDATGRFVEQIPGTAGCYLSTANCRSLEFFLVKEGDNDPRY